MVDLIGWAAVVGLFTAMYGGTVAGMVSRWSADGDASHGFLVLPIAAGLVWARREKLAVVPRRICLWGVPVLLLGLIATVVATWAEVGFAPAATMIIALGGLILYAAGPAFFREIIFPYTFLFFMVPWPDFLIETISFPLQLLTSTYATMIAGLLGVPIRREGVELYMPGFALTVAAECSGIRSMMALMALAALFAYFTRASLWRRALLFVSGIPVALIANVARVTLVLLLGLYYDKELALGLFHDYSSPALFAFSTLALMGLRKLVAECHDQTT
jgi:exosortase